LPNPNKFHRRRIDSGQSAGLRQPVSAKVSYRPAFEDPRARAVGDIVTIQIVEKVTASQVSKSTANRTTSM
jgi:flagellar basal body L-ring protein FlgH